LSRFGLKSLRELPQLKDVSEVFGDEVAQHLDVLETLDQQREPVQLEAATSKKEQQDQSE